MASIVALQRHLIRLNEVFGLDIHPLKRGTEVANRVELTFVRKLNRRIGR